MGWLFAVTLALPGKGMVTWFIIANCWMVSSATMSGTLFAVCRCVIGSSA